MILFYERINWENYPSVITPINEINLNKLDYAAKTLDERTVQLDTTKAEKETVLNTIQDWSMDEKTGIITITKVNGEQILFDLNVEKIPISFELSEDGILSMTTDDGTVFTANIGKMIPVITFNSTDTISVIVNGEGKNKTYSFEVKNGSITEDKLQPNFLADVKTESEKAQVSSSSASESATSANTFAQQAKQYRDETEQIKNDVQSIVDVDIATTEKAGIVKPDGTTITVDTDGTIHSVGGSGGTKDYLELSNKPKINGVELSGNKTNSDLGINASSIGADVSGSASQALSDAKSYTDAEVNEIVSNLPTELDSYEEIMANTQTKKSAGALGVKEGFEKMNNSLTFPDGTTFYSDIKDGKHGFNTDPNRGADTFFPFKSGVELKDIIFFTGTTLNISKEYGTELILIVTAYSSSGVSYSKKGTTIVSAIDATYELVNEYEPSVSNNIMASKVYKINITGEAPKFTIQQAGDNKCAMVLS